jgi:hypothetical protein
MKDEDLFVGLPMTFYRMMPDMTDRALRVFIVLKKYRNNKTGDCYPSYQTISDESKLNRNQIAYGIEELRILGFIQRVEKRTNKNTGRERNFYFLNENPNNLVERLEKAKVYLLSLSEKERQRKAKYKNGSKVERAIEKMDEEYSSKSDDFVPVEDPNKEDNQPEFDENDEDDGWN